MPNDLLPPRPTGQHAGAARLDMLERGFTLVDTPRFVDDRLLLRLTRGKTSLPYYSKRWWKYPQLARYACWLEGFLGKVLPEEPVALASLEFRREPAHFTIREVDRLHVDGGYIRAVCTLFGPSTVYLDGDVERSVPCGQTLLMTALERCKATGLSCTLHRRPGPGPERAVIVCSFTPRLEQPELENVYRRAAQSHRTNAARRLAD